MPPNPNPGSAPACFAHFSMQFQLPKFSSCLYSGTPSTKDRKDRDVLHKSLLVRERSALATLIFTLRVCLSICHSCLSFCLSATSELNISETRPDSGMVTMDGLYKLAYGLSIGHTPDDVT